MSDPYFSEPKSSRSAIGPVSAATFAKVRLEKTKKPNSERRGFVSRTTFKVSTDSASRSESKKLDRAGGIGSKGRISMAFSYRLAALVVAMAGVSACTESATGADQSGDIESDAAVASPGAASPSAPEQESFEDPEQLTSDLAVIRRACEATPNTNSSVCDCVVEEARALKPDELSLAVAQYEGDEARAADARGKLDVMGLTNGGSFLVNAPIMCSG